MKRFLGSQSTIQNQEQAYIPKNISDVSTRVESIVNQGRAFKFVLAMANHDGSQSGIDTLSLKPSNGILSVEVSNSLGQPSYQAVSLAMKLMEQTTEVDIATL